MSLYGGKFGATANKWVIPEAREHIVPDPKIARVLLESMRKTGMGGDGDGTFLSDDFLIGAGPVKAVLLSSTDGGHEAYLDEGRAIRVDWASEPDGQEYTFYIEGKTWKGRLGLEQLVRQHLRMICSHGH